MLRGIVIKQLRTELRFGTRYLTDFPPFLGSISCTPQAGGWRRRLWRGLCKYTLFLSPFCRRILDFAVKFNVCRNMSPFPVGIDCKLIYVLVFCLYLVWHYYALIILEMSLWFIYIMCIINLMYEPYQHIVIESDFLFMKNKQLILFL